MIKFLTKGLLRDRSRSLFPVLVITLTVTMVIFSIGFMKGTMNSLILDTAVILTGHERVVTRAYSEESQLMPNDLALMDVNQIMKMLPHRPPFLLIDKIFELTDEYVFFLMVYGNESIGDKMNFEYYNSYSNQTFKLDHNIDFESDMTIGNGLDPLAFGVDSPEIVSGLSIQSIYPNPFNPSTNIEYSISDGGRVSVLVYDIMGRQVGEIFNDYQIAGQHKIVWNAIDYSSGIYYIQININDNIQTQKVVLLK